jgi:hypothetical protein
MFQGCACSFVAFRDTFVLDFVLQLRKHDPVRTEVDECFPAAFLPVLVD